MGVLPRVYYSQEITAKISIIPSNQSGVHSVHVYEVRPRKDGRGFDLISDALPFGRLWYDGPNAVTNTIGIRQASLPLTRCCDPRLR